MKTILKKRKRRNNKNIFVKLDEPSNLFRRSRREKMCATNLFLIMVCIMFCSCINERQSNQGSIIHKRDSAYTMILVDTAISITPNAHLSNYLDSLFIDKIEISYSRLSFNNINVVVSKKGYGVYRVDDILGEGEIFDPEIEEYGPPIIGHKYYNVSLNSSSIVKLINLYMDLFVTKKFRKYSYRKPLPEDSCYDACPRSSFSTFLFRNKKMEQKDILLGDIYAKGKQSDGQFNVIYSREFKQFMQCLDYIGYITNTEKKMEHFEDYTNIGRQMGKDVLDIDNILDIKDKPIKIVYIDSLNFRQPLIYKTKEDE